MSERGQGAAEGLPRSNQEQAQCKLRKGKPYEKWALDAPIFLASACVVTMTSPPPSGSTRALAARLAPRQRLARHALVVVHDVLAAFHVMGDGAAHLRGRHIAGHHLA